MSRAFNEWLKVEVTPLLKGRGFARAGSYFRRRRDGNWALIHFQRSVKSSASRTLFTGTLGVWSRRVAHFVGRDPQVEKPIIDECHWTCRLGELLDEPDDRWWSFTGDSPDQSASKEVVDLVESRALPLLDRMSTDEALRDLWLSGTSPGLTDFQRLVYLSALIHEIGPRSLLRPVADELDRVTRGKSVAAAARAHLARILPGESYDANRN
jgi:hypothetical protein